MRISENIYRMLRVRAVGMLEQVTLLHDVSEEADVKLIAITRAKTGTSSMVRHDMVLTGGFIFS